MSFNFDLSANSIDFTYDQLLYDIWFVIYFSNKSSSIQSMSKPSVSPYRRNIYNNNKATVSPHREEPFKLAEKSKLSHSFVAEQANNTDKKLAIGKQQMLRATHKKVGYQYAPPLNHLRMETLMEQNKFLLTENNELANLLNDRSRIIIALEQKLEQQIAQQVQTLEQIELEKNRFLEEYSLKMREHSARNQCLMDQIAQLNEDLYQLEMRKNQEIEHLREATSREHRGQLENILNNHAQTVDLMQIENQKLKQYVSLRDNQLECLNHELKSTTERYRNKCEELERNISHILHMKKMELSQQKIEYEKIIEQIKRESQKIQQVSSSQYENEIKRVKKQLVAKQVQAEKLNHDISSNQIDSHTKINELYQIKSQLQDEILQLESFQKKLMFDETQRIKELAQTQLDNTQAMNKQLIDNIKAENTKLIELNQTRGNEITRLYIQIEDLRFKNERQCDDLRLQIDNLKGLVQNQKISYDEQNQAFKTKIAQLRHADIHSLQEYYQNQIATMIQDLQAKDQIIQQNRDKIHHQIQEKTQMRKNFEIQISKLKIRIGELELRIAGVIQERKQDIANFGSQMQLTSMTLLRTSEEKEKYAAFSLTEKQRLQKMIESKDKQIQTLNDKIQLMSQNHALEIKNKDEQIAILKKTIQELESNLKKQKFFLQNQIKKRESINVNDKLYYQSEITRVKRQAAEEQKRILNQLTSQKQIIDQQRIRLKKAEEQLSNQLKQVNSFREQQQLDRDIAISQSMNRITTEKESLQLNLKSYYKKQLDTRDNEIKDLKQQIAELNADIRLHLEKEQKLEEKLQKLLESQEKLRDMEQRVIALGQENNLVKNLSEIVKNRKR